MTVTLVWRTDVHLSDHTPVSRTDVWVDTVLNKLRSVGDLARSLGAQGVLDGGDFFDIKSPSRNSHELVRRTIEIHRGYPCPVFANVGNHDCVYGDYTYLHQQPLGVLYEAGTFQRLYDDFEHVFENQGVTVRVVGIPYHGVKYDMERFRRIQRGKEDYLIVLAHLLASRTATTMFESEDVVQYDSLDEYPIDCVLFGHWHKDQGVTRTTGGKTVVNIGSLTRGSLAQDDIDRIPSVAVLKFTKSGMVVEKKAIPHEPAGTVFNLIARDTGDVREAAMEEFATHLQASILVDKAEPLRDRIRRIPGVPNGVLERTLNYVEKAEGIHIVK